MSYLKLFEYEYPQTHSKDEAMQILARYKPEISDAEYDAIVYSLSSHALENIYLNEKDILLNIAQLRKEITLDEIVELAKAS